MTRDDILTLIGYIMFTYLYILNIAKNRFKAKCNSNASNQNDGCGGDADDDDDGNNHYLSLWIYEPVASLKFVQTFCLLVF